MHKHPYNYILDHRVYDKSMLSNQACTNKVVPITPAVCESIVRSSNWINLYSCTGFGMQTTYKFVSASDTSLCCNKSVITEGSSICSLQEEPWKSL